MQRKVSDSPPCTDNQPFNFDTNLPSDSPTCDPPSTFYNAQSKSILSTLTINFQSVAVNNHVYIVYLMNKSQILYSHVKLGYPLLSRQVNFSQHHITYSGMTETTDMKEFCWQFVMDLHVKYSHCLLTVRL